MPPQAAYAFEQIDRARAELVQVDETSWRRHVSVHRYRGFDAAVGGRPGCDAGCAGRPTTGVLHETVEAQRGLGVQHTGDGMCAAFSSPRSAVDAAVDAQRALELPVRMGIATGEAELRGNDYFGTVLNRAARVMAAGHGGQILLDGATAGSAHRNRPHRLGATTVTRHRQTSRHVSGPGAWPAHRLPAVADRSTRRLEICGRATTSFVGRETELADVDAALKATPAGDA